MAVVPADLLSPAGPVEEALFPSEGDGAPGTDLYERLQRYIARAGVIASGIAFPDPDPAVTAYALYLTFQAAYMGAISRPAMENAQVPILGSTQFDKDQRDALKELYLEYQAEYNTLVSAVPTVQIQRGVPTRSTPNVFEW